MGKNDYYKKGEWNVTCDRCGAKRKSGKIRREWNNLLVCERCFEERHPQDFIKIIKDDQTVPFYRPPLREETK